MLSVMKILVGLLAGSLAVLADGIDSASDIVTSVITLITAHLITRPPNIRYPYGYDKADTLASKALAFIIFFAGAQLAITTVSNLIEGKEREIPGMATLIVTVVSIFGKYGLAWYQMRIGRKVGSSMLVANARNMQNDVIISVAVLTGLFFTFVLELPVIDTITAMAVSVWIMYVAFKIYMQTNRELMDGVDDPGIYKTVFAAVSKIRGVHNPHHVRIRKSGHRYVIAVDIEVDGSLSVNSAHELAHKVDEQIRKDVKDVYDILVHVEPYGDKDDREKFGVSNKDLN